MWIPSWEEGFEFTRHLSRLSLLIAVLAYDARSTQSFPRLVNLLHPKGSRVTTLSVFHIIQKNADVRWDFQCSSLEYISRGKSYVRNSPLSESWRLLKSGRALHRILWSDKRTSLCSPVWRKKKEFLSELSHAWMLVSVLPHLSVLCISVFDLATVLYQAWMMLIL